MKKTIDSMNIQAEQAKVHGEQDPGFRVEAGSKILKPDAEITPMEFDVDLQAIASELKAEEEEKKGQ